MIDIPEQDMSCFSMENRDDAVGILFRFEKNNGTFLWAYQHIWPMAIPNKKERSFIAKWQSPERQDVFVEMKDKLFSISQKVDLLIVNSEIETETITEVVTDNIALMQTHFGFERFIRASAGRAISSIASLQLVANSDKMVDYINRGDKKYAKKMMRIKNSKVFNLRPEQLLEKVRNLPRWRGKFVTEDNKIILNTYAHVENLIDLFDERYTRSDVTGEEYDTEVKSLAESLEANIAG